MKNIFAKVLSIVVVVSVVVSNVLPGFEFAYAQEAVEESVTEVQDENVTVFESNEIADSVETEISVLNDDKTDVEKYDSADKVTDHVADIEPVDVVDDPAPGSDEANTDPLPGEQMTTLVPEGDLTVNCANGDLLTASQFRRALNLGLITYSLSPINSSSKSATFTLQNRTGCLAEVSLASYKMYDVLPTLSTQVLFDRVVVNVTSSASLTVRLSKCNTQVDAFFGVAPTELLDSNPYPNADWSYIPHLLAYDFLLTGMCSPQTDKDNTPPEIDLINNPTITVIAGQPFVDPGAVAFDLEDGNITSWIVTSSDVNPFIPGTYSISYEVTDSRGLTASVTRIVIVVPPGCENDQELTVEEFRDGVSHGLITYGGIEFGTTTASFTLHNYTGCTAPISLTSYKMYQPLPNLSTQVLFDREGIVGATSTTVLQVDLPRRCASQIDAWFGLGPENLDNSNPYFYPNIPYVLTYGFAGEGSCTQIGLGNTNTAPVITVVGSNPVILDLNSKFVDPGATALDLQDGNLTSEIVAVSTVNTSIAGSYTITYSVTDSGGLSDTEVRTVIVGEEFVGSNTSNDNSGGSRRNGQRRMNGGSQGEVLGASTGPDTVVTCEYLQGFLNQDWSNSTAAVLEFLKTLAGFTQTLCNQNIAKG